jgi:hypothetical protein
MLKFILLRLQLILTPPLLLLLWQMLPWLRLQGLLLSGCCDGDCDFRCCAAAIVLLLPATTAASFFSHCKCEVKIWMLNLSAY